MMLQISNMKAPDIVVLNKMMISDHVTYKPEAF